MYNLLRFFLPFLRLEEDAGEECLFECEKVEYLARLYFYFLSSFLGCKVKHYIFRLQYGDVDPKPVEEVGIDSK